MRKPKPRSLHARAASKDRGFWFFQHVSFPMRDASPVELEKFWAAQTQADISPQHRWECLGPFNLAGRVTSLVIHPEDPKKWFAGSATGGVWMSRDAGESWSPAWSPFASQNIGALAWKRSHRILHLIVATGEANMSGDSYPGTGVYISDDEALTWQPMFTPPPGEAAATLDADVKTFPRRIGCIAVNRRGRLALGSVYLDDSLPAGLYLYNGAEGLEPCEFWGTRSYNCHSVLFHPQDDRTIFATIEPDGALNGIWRSRDAGNVWEHLTKGLPSGDHFRRTSLAFAPSDPEVMYALSSDPSNHILGVFRSTNGGNSWREILGARFPKERQMAYNNTIAVHPTNPNSVVWGGMKLYRTDNAGRNWRRITSGQRGDKNFTHNDHHVLLWPEDDMIISGNDGGVSVTRNGGRTWQDRSSGMVTTMFYDLDVAPSNGKIFAGGTQDQGTLIAGVEERPVGEFVPAISGDGAWVVFDPSDAENVFAASSGFNIFRHRRGQSWEFDGWDSIMPPKISAAEASQRAFTVMAIEPTARHGPKRLWAGSARLWCTKDNGRHWRPASPVFDGSPVSAIEVARANPRVLFAGTTRGGIFRTLDGGVTWSQNLAGSDVPARTITSIQTHPKTASTVVVTVASTGTAGSGVELRSGLDLPYRHVFRSTDCGIYWEDIDLGWFPNVAIYAAAYETHPPYRLFVAGDVGVGLEKDGVWLKISGNLPNVVVSDLVYHHQDRTLTAATYGRGVWRLPVGELKFEGVVNEPQERIPLAAGLRVDPSIPVPVQLTPADRAVFDKFPRVTAVTVQPVPGAIGYQVQIEVVSAQLNFSASSTTPKIVFNFPGAGEGRWRVWAILPDGCRSNASNWRSFNYLG